jgi:hypothetical protein
VYYRIRFLSNQNIVTLSNAIYLEGVDHFSSFIVYPNPATTTIHLQSGNSDFKKLLITDMTGRSEIEMNITSATAAVDISTLAAGAYMARLIGNDGLEQHQKFIKVK